MKLEFKFSVGNFIGFVLMGGLFYWLVPLPQTVWLRALVCACAGLVLFGMCFVVVSHKQFIRPATPQEKKHKK